MRLVTGGSSLKEDKENVCLDKWKKDDLIKQGNGKGIGFPKVKRPMKPSHLLKKNGGTFQIMEKSIEKRKKGDKFNYFQLCGRKTWEKEDDLFAAFSSNCKFHVHSSGVEVVRLDDEHTFLGEEGHWEERRVLFIPVVVSAKSCDTIEEVIKTEEKKVKKVSTGFSQSLKIAVKSELYQRKIFTCSVCGATFSHRNSLSRHTLKHRTGKCFSCDICHKMFWRNYHLKRHMHFCQQKLNESLNPNMGLQNIQKVKAKREEERKEKKLNKPKVVPCTVCGKTYARAYMKMHIKSHEEIKQFPCHKCLRLYKSEEYIKNVHNKICRGLHHCRVCDLTFIKAEQLRHHNYRKHPELREFSCKQCDLRFTTKYKLNRHILVHTKERSFSCKFCEKTFARADTLFQHKERIHKVKQFEEFKESTEIKLEVV